MNRSWLRDGFMAMWHEVRSYLETSWALVRGPAMFAKSWYEGTRPAMNPLAMLATGATLLAAIRQLAMTILDIPRPDSIIAAVLSALGPYAHYVLIGLICHAVMFRARDVSITDTIAIALFAGAGPTAIVEAIGWLALCPFGHSPLAEAVMLGVVFSLYCFVLSTALGGLFKSRLAPLAIMIAMPLTGLLFGYLQPPGSYGLHWVLHLSPFFLGLGL